MYRFLHVFSFSKLSTVEQKFSHSRQELLASSIVGLSSSNANKSKPVSYRCPVTFMSTPSQEPLQLIKNEDSSPFTCGGIFNVLVTKKRNKLTFHSFCANRGYLKCWSEASISKYYLCKLFYGLQLSISPPNLRCRFLVCMDRCTFHQRKPSFHDNHCQLNMFL